METIKQAEAWVGIAVLAFQDPFLFRIVIVQAVGFSANAISQFQAGIKPLGELGAQAWDKSR